jgi:hypothetical protein
MSKWFTANKLALSSGKTNIIKFLTSNSPQCAFSIGQNGKYIELFHTVDIVRMKSIYFAYFHSIMKYRIIFRGNSINSTRVFTLQRKIITIMAGAKPRNSC